MAPFPCIATNTQESDPSYRPNSVDYKKKNALVWYKKEKEGKNTLSKSERQTVLLLASFIPG